MRSEPTELCRSGQRNIKLWELWSSHYPMKPQKFDLCLLDLNGNRLEKKKMMVNS